MSNPSVLLIADQFANAARSTEEKYPGGAELTDAAAIEACPWVIETCLTTDCSSKLLDQFDIHVLGNADSASPELLDALAQRGRHVLFEHDIRICRFRGNFPADLPHYVHHRCLCNINRWYNVFDTARGIVFLTSRQRCRYYDNFGFPDRWFDKSAVVGSSLMGRSFFELVDQLQKEPTGRDIDTVIVYSPNLGKGFAAAENYCYRHNLKPFVIRDMQPEQVYATLSRARRLVFLPTAPEAAGRLLIEARFLGCEIVSNENAGVCGEPWWDRSDDEALAQVQDAPRRFWHIVEALFSSSYEPSRSVPRPGARFQGISEQREARERPQVVYSKRAV